MKKTNTKAALNFISEAGLLKRIKRSGWWVVGIDHPESVAEHSFRCAVIGYVLASMEKINPYQVLLMTLFGDLHEARINDAHKMAQRYLAIDHAEDEAFAEQIQALPFTAKEELKRLRKNYRAQKSKESIVARDADILECLIQAKEYTEYGYAEAKKFMRKAPQFLISKSARLLWRHAQTMKLAVWWERLSDFRR